MTDTNETYRVEGGELRMHVEKIERIQAEKAELAETEKDFFACAKSAGYDGKILRKVIARRKMDRDALAEEGALISMYEDALV